MKNERIIMMIVIEYRHTHSPWVCHAHAVLCRRHSHQTVTTSPLRLQNNVCQTSLQYWCIFYFLSRYDEAHISHILPDRNCPFIIYSTCPTITTVYNDPFIYFTCLIMSTVYISFLPGSGCNLYFTYPTEALSFVKFTCPILPIVILFYLFNNPHVCLSYLSEKAHICIFYRSGNAHILDV